LHREESVTPPGYRLPRDLDAKVRSALEDWADGGQVNRLWARDATLWSGRDEARWLGWLGIVDQQLGRLDELRRAADDVRRAGFRDILLLGMGGSSLCPEVLKLTFGRVAGWPELHVLDSTDPAQVRTFETRVDLARTLCVVASKSGTTLEPSIFKQYFFERLKATVGAAEAGRRFVAITDPGSELARVAEADGFRQVFFGLPSIGGRYSALSDFGMVPAALMGLDLARFLGGAAEMTRACAASVPVEENPGAVLGIVMGVLAKDGRDKATLVASPAIHALGAWLEQLLAESTGKEGKGLIPVDREPLGAPEVYGVDRLFVYLRLTSAPDAEQDRRVEALERAGQPLVRITVDDPYDLGAEFFRWEFATAVAGAILHINPFDQPDVEASKLATRRLTDEYEKTGALPSQAAVRADDTNLHAALRSHLGRLGAGDYVALLAYVEMNAAYERELQAIRAMIRDRYRVATCLGFGPRFLHSTGQAYKGGPNSGVFLQITCDDAVDVPVPGQKYTFGIVKAAQDQGDFQVLVERRRRALRIHLGKDVKGGLATLQSAVSQATA
jgi:transaldolase / glucose-6-phosphate isomerase